MAYKVFGTQEEGLYWEVGCYSEGCYLEVLLYKYKHFSVHIVNTFST